MTRAALTIVTCATLLWAGPLLAAPPLPPETSLNNCQNAVKVETLKFIKNKETAIGACLQRVSTEVVRNNVDTTKAAATCVLQFRKVNDSRGLGKSLGEKLVAGIKKKCLPGGTNTHTFQDILGSGPGVAEPLNAMNINEWCRYFGGDGSIDSVDEWIACVMASAECSVDAAISTQYPRTLEWLAAVKGKMAALTAPAIDPTKITDAVAGLDMVKNAIDGPDNDLTPSIHCGSFPVCGDGVKNGGEQCDGSDLGGASCNGLGFSEGTLGCTAGCAFDASSCSGICMGFPATGQTTCWRDSGVVPCAGTGHDGHFHTGAALQYTDIGNGTVVDLNTGLMWETKSDDGSLHDRHNYFPWSGYCTLSGAECWTDATCGSGTCQAFDGQGGDDTIFEWVARLNALGGFAGHTDWRIPNVQELHSIAHFGASDPAVDAVFNTTCNPGCTNCSCTQSSAYWSSTTVQDSPSLAWLVGFNSGYVDLGIKTSPYYVRAVRGGL